MLGLIGSCLQLLRSDRWPRAWQLQLYWDCAGVGEPEVLEVYKSKYGRPLEERQALSAATVSEHADA